MPMPLKSSNEGELEYCVEIAQSHEGSLGYALTILESLSARGVSLVKFQMHLPEYESTLSERFRVRMSGQDDSRFGYWDRTGFTLKQWKVVKSRCEELGIEFLCTPLSTMAVDWLEELNVKRYKIASGDAANPELLDYISQTKKPVILSTGMSNWEEIDLAVSFFEIRKLTLLQCLSKYPASVNEIDFNVMKKFYSRYPGVIIGYSDHTGNPLMSMIAFAHGAKFVEQHIVYSREQYGPDSGASIELGDVKQVIEFMRLFKTSQTILYDKDEAAIELVGLRENFFRGLALKADVKAGEIISLDLLTLKKPRGPLQWNDRDLIGSHRASRDLSRYSHLSLDDVEISSD
jgi:N-acetylneuraminate synthase